MIQIAGIGFTTPWLLLGLLALPALWLLLRAVPPAPVVKLFPAVTLLLGLRDDESTSDRTPWWLLLLRTLAVAAVILGLAGPVMNPNEQVDGDGPVLVVLDSSWAGASEWPKTMRILAAELDKAGRAGRPVALLSLAAPDTVVFQSAETWKRRLVGLNPHAWQPSSEQLALAVDAIAGIDGGFDTFWISDSLDYEGRSDLTAQLQERGTLRVFETGQPVLGLLPATYADGAMSLTALRSQAGPAREVTLQAEGRDPGGTERILASVPARFEAGQTSAVSELSLPAELRARVTRFTIQGHKSAGATALTDDALRRREVALISGREAQEGLELLSPHHYLRQALITTTDLIEGGLLDLLPANPDAIVLTDIATLSDAEREPLTEWVEAGGLLLRFAGPRVAASDVSRQQEDPLMPVRLRSGGRSIGGAMSWGEPKTLAPFPDGSPFKGLKIPQEVNISAQVMAQPDPALADRVIAALTDGTPLVTRKPVGQGQVVLFHVTANAEWSSLPLSGLFVEMLERLAVSSATGAPDASDLEGTTWIPVRVMDGFGGLQDASNLPGVDGPSLARDPAGPALQPGLYQSEDRLLARNVLPAGSELEPATWPDDVPVEGLRPRDELPLTGALLSAALVLLALDVLASLMLSGRLRGSRVAPLLALMLLIPDPTSAQDSNPDLAIIAASELALAHVLTGDRRVDDVARAGLQGLSDTLYFRTSVEPANPVGVDLEQDELAFFPLLYWPITSDQPIPSKEAYARLNAYLRAGGMILFDTRDSDIAGFGTASPNGRKLQQLARPLDIPPLEPLPHDHVLTRTFYLLQDFPGRHPGGEIWVEAAPADAEQIEGMPFRNLNDGVTPVVIGGNDWAGAWAVDANGRPLLPVGRGFAGERQRELANRFGVNLIMHVLTGNYKSDQVHVPALLDRLGQ
ncbi:DUF4159 domain-containing protein [Primorskyibacter sp. S87]|uniref:DUF4159 domain-containing protein n=1 Tax=Primorskyibacter sp. S87 TaxID=3415126 RepID=UPI003C7AADB6